MHDSNFSIIGAATGTGEEFQEMLERARSACRPDEVAVFDPLAGEWFGVRDGDYSDHRNVRLLLCDPEDACATHGRCWTHSTEDR